MSERLVVVDTSVWVEFFNRHEGEHRRRVIDLLDDDRVALIGVIAAEIVRGCRTAEEREAVESAFTGVHRLEVTFSRWMEVGRELFDLRRKGLTLSVSDAVIAHAARESNSALYSLDADFDHFPGLRRYP